MKKLFYFTIALLLLSMASCKKDVEFPGAFGMWEFINETSLDCTVRIYSDRSDRVDFANLKIPAGQSRFIDAVVFLPMGYNPLERYEYASVEFSDSTKIVYTWDILGYGNILVRHEIEEIDGQYIRRVRITEEIHEAALETE